MKVLTALFCLALGCTAMAKAQKPDNPRKPDKEPEGIWTEKVTYTANHKGQVPFTRQADAYRGGKDNQILVISRKQIHIIPQPGDIIKLHDGTTMVVEKAQSLGTSPGVRIVAPKIPASAKPPKPQTPKASTPVKK